MRKILVAAAIISAASSPLMAKDKEKISTLALQQMQSREFEVTKDEAFAAVMTVLQDSGYRIGSADRDTGLITGAASTKTSTTWMPFVGFGKKKKTPVVSAYVEGRGPNVARVRLNFVMTKNVANTFGGSADEDPIMDSAVYTDAFERVSKEIFVRVSMRSGPSVTAPGAAGATSEVPVSSPAAPVAITPVSVQPK